MRETQVPSLGWEDPLAKEMATHSSTLAWRIPWTKEPGGLQPMESLRVWHDWATSLSLSSTTSQGPRPQAVSTVQVRWATTPWQAQSWDFASFPHFLPRAAFRGEPQPCSWDPRGPHIQQHAGLRVRGGGLAVGAQDSAGSSGRRPLPSSGAAPPWSARTMQLVHIAWIFQM